MPAPSCMKTNATSAPLTPLQTKSPCKSNWTSIRMFMFIRSSLADVVSAHSLARVCGICRKLGPCVQHCTGSHYTMHAALRKITTKSNQMQCPDQHKKSCGIHVNCILRFLDRTGPENIRWRKRRCRAVLFCLSCPVHSVNC